MSWLFGRRRDENEFTRVRNKQIEDMLKHLPTIQLNIDDRDKNIQTYKFPISTVYGRLTIHIIVGPFFPNVAPILVMANRSIHRYIDNNPATLAKLIQQCVPQINKLKSLGIDSKDGSGGVIITQKLASWTPYTAIESVLLEIKNEFEAHPPTPAILAASGSGGGGSSSSSGGGPSQSTSAYASPTNTTPVVSPHNAAGTSANASYHQSQGQGYLSPPSYNNNLSSAASTGNISLNHTNPANSSGSSNIVKSSSFPANLNLNATPPPAADSTADKAKQSSHHSSSASTDNLLASIQDISASMMIDSHTKDIELPTSYPILDTLSISELEDLSNDRDAFTEFALQLEGVNNINKIKQELYENIERLANGNIEKRRELSLNQKESIIEEKRTLLQSLLQELNSIQQRIQSMQQHYDINELQNELDTAINEADASSDEIRDTYQPSTSQLSTDDHSKFINAYLKARILFHERNAKRESFESYYGKG